MGTPRENLRGALEKIKAKLEEARRVASDSGIEPNPKSRSATDPSVPDSVVSLIDAAIQETENVIFWHFEGEG